MMSSMISTDADNEAGSAFSPLFSDGAVRQVNGADSQNGHPHILTVLVENKAGVLARIASLFARRGFNIFSLAVAPTEDPRFSRVSMVVDLASAPLEQIVKQLDKLINVVSISELDPTKAVQAELALISVDVSPSVRGQVIELAGIFGAKIVDVGHECLTVMLAGDPSQVDAFRDLIAPYGILGVQRTGSIALPRATKSLSDPGSKGSAA